MQEKSKPIPVSSRTHRAFSRFKQSLMLQHILAQPETIQKTISGQKGQVQELSDALAKAGRLSVLSCGSSFHVANLLKHAMDGQMAIEVAEQPLLYSGTPPILLFISQSGCSGDLLPSFENAKANRSYRVALTNSPQSLLALQSDLAVFTHAPDESALVPAIGSMTGAVASAYHIAASAMAAPYAKSRALAVLDALPEQLELFIGSIRGTPFESVADILKAAHYIYFAGQGALRWVAAEAALKVRETAEILTDSGSISGARHGFLSAFGSRIPAIRAIPKAIVLFAEAADAPLVKQYEGMAAVYSFPLITVACGAGCKFRASFFIPAPSEAAKAISAISFSQMLAHDLAVHYGLEPGSSRINTKVVQ